MRKPFFLANLAAAGVAGGALLLRFFPPGRFSFYPECPIFHFFHVYCPGCRATRALAALTQGHFTEALGYNPFVVCLLPPLLLYLAIAYRNAMRNEAFRWPAFPPLAAQALCVAALLFAAVRNVLHFEF